MALGATDQTALSRSTGKAIGEEAGALGINQVLAPDGDVNVNAANPIIGLRSFGSDATAVAGMTAAMVQGFQQDAGVGAAVKHFPGHGDTNIDSHSQLPIINHTAQQWATIDEPPFAAAIDADVDMVMVGHLAFPALDPSGAPASLSPPIVDGVLRQQMGYDGVVITDSLVMGALTNTYGDDRVPVLGLLAGDDILLIPPSLPVAFSAVQAAVHSGEISADRLDASVRRILALKIKLGLFTSAPVSIPDAVAAVGSDAHRSIEQQDAQSSITLIANDGGVLPLRNTKQEKFLIVGPTKDAVDALAAEVRGRALSVATDVIGTDPDAAAASGAAAQAADADTVIDMTLDADADDGQQRVEAALAATGTRLITASIGRPYDQAYYKAAVNLCAYSDSLASITALAGVLFGDMAPAGHLPVAIPDPKHPANTLYPLGFGLGY